jgi:hypothetical protein
MTEQLHMERLDQVTLEKIEEKRKRLAHEFDLGIRATWATIINHVATHATASGNEIWRVNLEQEFGQTIGTLINMRAGSN